MTNNIKSSLKVFLCHASDDKPKVRKLYNRLIADGYDAWLDEAKLLPGQEWRIEIPKAVRDADVFIVCVSNNSINKEGYVQKEIAFSLDIAEEKPEGTIYIIPAKLEPCNIPGKLSRWQWVDLFQDDGYDKIYSSLEIRSKKLRNNNVQDVFEQTESQIDKNLDPEQIKIKTTGFESHKQLKKKLSENYWQSKSYDQARVDSELIQERQLMKKDNYISPDLTLPGLIFGTVGYIVCLITRRKEPLPWTYSMLVLALVIQLPTLVMSNLLNEREQWAALGFFMMAHLELGLFSTVLAYRGFKYLHTNLKNYVFDEIQSVNHLRDLQKILLRACSTNQALPFSAVFTLFWCVGFSSISSSYTNQFIGYGILSGAVVFGFLLGSALYMLAWSYNFVIRLALYDYYLNATSPANTEVVARLSRVCTFLIYNISVFISFAAITVSSNTEIVLLVTLMGWSLMIVYFISSQFTISRIITTGKWKTLNRIHNLINDLYDKDIPNKNNIEAIDRLTGFHKQISITPNSTLNFGTALNFINQLALPLVGFLLANIEKIRHLFSP